MSEDATARKEAMEGQIDGLLAHHDNEAVCDWHKPNIIRAADAYAEAKVHALTKQRDALRELLRDFAAAVHMAEDHEDVTEWAVWKRVMAELKDTAGIDDILGVGLAQALAGQGEGDHE